MKIIIIFDDEKEEKEEILEWAKDPDVNDGVY